MPSPHDMDNGNDVASETQKWHQHTINDALELNRVLHRTGQTIYRTKPLADDDPYLPGHLASLQPITRNNAVLRAWLLGADVFALEVSILRPSVEADGHLGIVENGKARTASPEEMDVAAHVLRSLIDNIPTPSVDKHSRIAGILSHFFKR